MKNLDQNKSSVLAAIRFLVSILVSSPAIVFAYTPLLAATTALGIALPFATGRFIDALVAGGNAIKPFALLATLFIVSTLASSFLRRFIKRCSRRIELNLQYRVLTAIMNFAPHELAELKSGKLVAKLMRDTSAAESFVGNFYPGLLTVATTMIAAAFALYSRSVVLSIAFAAFIPLAVAMFLPFARRFSKNSGIVRKNSDNAYASIFEFLYTIPFLRTLGAEQRFADEPRNALGALNKSQIAADALGVSFNLVLSGTLVLGEIVVLGIAGTLAAKGVIPVGDVIMYQMLFITAVSAVQGLVSLLPEAAALREGINSLREVLTHPPEALGVKEIGAIETLEFRHVTFAYPKGKPVLDDFSAVFRAGRVTALAGANGTGKTTLLKLATGVLKPQSGEILVNGTNLEEIDMLRFRREIGVVFQDSPIASGTIRDNITLREAEFSEADVAAAVTASRLDDVLKKLPDGLDTRVGLGKRHLSGGEQQRLAIARALIRKCKLLVLDEATNHLDAQSRAGFGRLLHTLAPGRITLLVSHDDTFTSLCDDKIEIQ